jgi:hypothetical protein
MAHVRIACGGLLSLMVAARMGGTAEPPPIVDEATRGRLLEYHRDVCEWIMTLDVGSGRVTNHWTEGPPEYDPRVFVCGNLARVLLAGYRLSADRRYLDEALRWAESFHRARRAAPGRSDAGYWREFGALGNLYLADVGTATTAFALISEHAEPSDRERYRTAMERYAAFVTGGSEDNPKGWRVTQGPDRGALSCGYYMGRLSTAPYIISTGTTGGAFFATLYRITGKDEYRDVARDAVAWLFRAREESGRFPYILDGKSTPEWPLDTITYAAEGFIAAYAHSADRPLRDLIAREAAPTVAYVVRDQNADGSWGALRSDDQERSPGVVSLLNWYYHNVEPDPDVAAAVRRYCEYLLVDANSEACGVRILLVATGFVGLAVAEVIDPGITFRVPAR